MLRNTFTLLRVSASKVIVRPATSVFALTVRYKSGPGAVPDHQHGRILDTSTSSSSSTSHISKPSTINFSTSDDKNWQAYDKTAVRIEAEALEQARTILKDSNAWKALMTTFPSEQHLARSENSASIFDGVPDYYRRTNISRAAGDLAWELAVDSLGVTGEELDADKAKEEECAKLSDSIEEVCYCGIELGLLEPVEATKATLQDKETVEEALRRLAGAEEIARKFLGGAR